MGGLSSLRSPGKALRGFRLTPRHSTPASDLEQFIAPLNDSPHQMIRCSPTGPAGFGSVTTWGIDAAGWGRLLALGAGCNHCGRFPRKATLGGLQADWLGRRVGFWHTGLQPPKAGYKAFWVGYWHSGWLQYTQYNKKIRCAGRKTKCRQRRME